MAIATLYAGQYDLSGGSGGGNVLTGDATIWPSVPTPASLEESASVRNGDRQATSSPNRIWERVSGSWQVRQATESLASSLPTVDVITGALGFVGTAGYVFNGSTWDRSGVSLNQPYARTLSSLQDVLATDLDGDYGLFNGMTMRLKRSISLPGGATANLWVPPVVYAGTITARAYAIGTESNTGLSTTLANQGWTIVLGGNGAITATGSDIQATASGGGGSAVLRTLVSGMTSTTNVYCQVDIAGTLGSAGNITLYTTDTASLFYFSQNNVAAAAQTWIRANSSSTDAVANQYRNGAATALPTIASGNRTTFQFIDQGTTTGVAWRDGQIYQSARKAFTPGNFGNFIHTGVGTGAGGVNTTATWRNFYVLTWV